MNQKMVMQLVAFVVILLALNYFFALHISILGSVLLTLVLSFVFSGFGRK